MTDLFYLLKFQHNCRIVMGAAFNTVSSSGYNKKTVIECIC